MRWGIGKPLTFNGYGFQMIMISLIIYEFNCISGSAEDKLKVLFLMYDLDGNKQLTRTEIGHMIK